MRVFGLTGGVASGKSVVAAHYRGLGVPVIDADDLAREIVRPGTEALAEIVERFGPEVLAADGSLDRARLAAIIFDDAHARRALEAITHPRVATRLRDELDTLARRAASLVCYEVPLLFENELQEHFRPVVLVAAEPETQVRRAMARNGWSREQTLARIAAQMPLSDKRRLADFVIDNDGNLDATLRQAEEVLARVRCW